MNREEKIELLKDTCKKSLEAIGEDPQREGLQRTPERLARTFLELTRGYAMDPVATLQSAVFHEEYDQMVVVKDIEFYSLCEHHILPFFGKVHVAYIPNGNIVGLSKIPRMVDIFSHRLQVQEHLTKQICDCLQQALNPLGAIVVVCKCRNTSPNRFVIVFSRHSILLVPSWWLRHSICAFRCVALRNRVLSLKQCITLVFSRIPRNARNS